MKTNPNEPNQSQNEPNFPPLRGSPSQNKPNQTQSPKNPKINATSVLTKDYRNGNPFTVKMNASAGLYHRARGPGIGVFDPDMRVQGNSLTQIARAGR
jgi:hypothetical protein